MDLEREKLERIDRKLLARLCQDEAFQMVRVPVTAAKWATWKRYCEAAGTSMGRAIVALIERELGVFDDFDDDHQPASTGDAQEQLAAREEELNARERELATERNRVIADAERLRIWQSELRTIEYDLEIRSRLTAQRTPADPKVGRNERCPCGSGLKYKQCHGR
jgi:hypothetical protein